MSNVDISPWAPSSNLRPFYFETVLEYVDKAWFLKHSDVRCWASFHSKSRMEFSTTYSSNWFCFAREPPYLRPQSTEKLVNLLPWALISLLRHRSFWIAPICCFVRACMARNLRFISPYRWELFANVHLRTLFRYLNEKILPIVRIYCSPFSWTRLSFYMHRICVAKNKCSKNSMHHRWSSQNISNTQQILSYRIK